MWHLQHEASLQPEQRGEHVVGWEAGRKEAGRRSEGAQRAFTLSWRHWEAMGGR